MSIIDENQKCEIYRHIGYCYYHLVYTIFINQIETI